MPHHSLDQEIHDSQALTATCHKKESDRGGNTAVFFSSRDVSIHDAEGVRTGWTGRDWQGPYVLFAFVCVCYLCEACGSTAYPALSKDIKGHLLNRFLILCLFDEKPTR